MRTTNAVHDLKLGTFIRGLLEEKGVSTREAARRMEMPRATLMNILQGRTTEPDTQTIVRLSTFFDVSVEDIFHAAGLLEPRTPAPGRDAAVPALDDVIARLTSGRFSPSVVRQVVSIVNALLELAASDGVSENASPTGVTKLSALPAASGDDPNKVAPLRGRRGQQLERTSASHLLRFTRENAEQCINCIYGVLKNQLVLDSNDDIQEVHLLIDDTRLPEQIAEDVETLLLVQFNRSVDYGKIRVARLQKNAGEASTPGVREGGADLSPLPGGESADEDPIMAALMGSYNSQAVQRMDSADDEEALAKWEFVTILTEALEQLPPTNRAVLSLRYMQGVPVADIANTLNCSMATVKMRLARAREQLRDTLERRTWEELSAAWRRLPVALNTPSEE